jgi:hypothetical protein
MYLREKCKNSSCGWSNLQVSNWIILKKKKLQIALYGIKVNSGVLIRGGATTLNKNIYIKKKKKKKKKKKIKRGKGAC